jgi:hypothetical protein
MAPPTARHTRAAVRADQPGAGLAGEGAGVPGSGAQGDRHLQVGVGVDETQPLSPLEDGADALPPGGDDLGLVAFARLGRGAVLQHGADQGEPPGTGDAPLEIGSFSPASRSTTDRTLRRTGGRPEPPRCDTRAHRRRTMSRCQRKIVAGVTISRIAASRLVGSVPASSASHGRSGHVKRE